MRLFTDFAAQIVDPFLARASTLAQNGRGMTSPNPLVGCVLVRDGVVVGEGFHERAGGPHAEMVALAAARESARGATAYVTLEPCDHFGRTPPCSQALIDAGVSSVVIGMADPTEQASGGAARLRAAGIAVSFATEPAPFAELNEAWLHHLLTRRPYVHVKVALSLDGHPTSGDGVRSAVSGHGGLRATMRLRSAADAVLVGASTARIDDPKLTVRDPDTGDVAPPSRQPLRVVLGQSGLPDASLFHDGAGDALALMPQDVSVPDDVTVLRYHAAGDSAPDLTAALTVLGEHGIRRVLVEAGPRLFTALYDASLIDELTLVHAGGVFGQAAPALFLGHDRASVQSTAPEGLCKRMEAVEAGIIEGDAVTVWRPLGAQDAFRRPKGDSE